jgi:hypothetical protein
MAAAVTAASSAGAIFGPDGLGLLAAWQDPVFTEPGAGSGALRRRCRDWLGQAPAGGAFAVVVPTEAAGMAKLRRWLGLRFEMSALDRAIVSAGGRIVGRYAVAPNLERPTFVYELDTAAGNYARTHLLAGHVGRTASRRWRAALERWAGCDLDAGAVVIVGEKR